MRAGSGIPGWAADAAEQFAGLLGVAVGALAA